jgi:phosphatidate cytidylyltransferase
MNNEIVKRIISSIILVPVTLFFIVKGTFFFNFFILICFIITGYEWHMMTKKKPYSVFGFFFLIFSFYSIYKLRNEFIGDYIYILLITLICISTDIGGYLFGNIFKGPKLTKLSPKKTYSGMIGGYFLATISIATLYSNNLFFLKNEDLTLNIFIFIILVSSVSQLGDIFISYFKRISKIKDTGKIIPGHGGLLDRADGMIFAFPFSYIILKLEIFQYF